MSSLSHQRPKSNPLRDSFRLLFAIIAGIMPSCGASFPDTSDHRHQCSRIHLNHIYSDETGVLITHQILFEDWHESEGQHHIEGWILAQNGRPHIQRVGDEYRARWSNQFAVITVTARHFTESWTPYDPEVVDRSEHPERTRRLRHIAGYRLHSP